MSESLKKEDLEKSHMVVSQTISNLMGEHKKKLGEVEDELRELKSDTEKNRDEIAEIKELIKDLRDDFQPLLDFMTTITFGKKLVVGIASVVASLGAIGLFIKGLK